MHRIFDCTPVAMLAGLAASAAAAASSDFLLTLPPGKGELAGKAEEVVIQSFSWGPRQTTSADGSRMDGHSMLGASDRAAATHDVSSPRDGGLGSESERTGAGRALDIAAVDGQPASHGAGTLVLQGSLRGCTVGRRYAGAQFAGNGRLYELKDVVISNCAANGVGLDYGRVTVRGWDPEKKQ